MARLIRTEKEVEGRYEEVWLVVEEDALEQWPAGPREVVGKLHASLTKVLSMPDVREKLLTAGIEPATSKSPEEFAAFIRAQADTRAKVIQAVGMKLD